MDKNVGSEQRARLYRRCASILRVLFKWTTTGRTIGSIADLPSSGSALIVCNHISHFDPPYLSSLISRPVDWVAMQELMRTGWARRFFVALNTIPVRRGVPDRRAIREAVARLRAGRVVGIFPEGGLRHAEGSLLQGARPHRGVQLISRLSGAPVVPMAIVGTDRLYNPWYWLGPRRAPVWVAVGRCLPAANDGHAGWLDDITSEMVALAERIRLEGGARSEDFPQSPQDRLRRM